MNITFLKCLIISFGFHAFAISLFLIDGKVFKKSETSMTEIIIVSSTENNNVKKKQTDKREIIKTRNLKEKTIDANILKAQEKIQKSLGLKVNILNKKNNSGKVTIEYKDLDQFQLISELLTNH